MQVPEDTSDISALHAPLPSSFHHRTAVKRSAIAVQRPNLLGTYGFQCYKRHPGLDIAGASLICVTQTVVQTGPVPVGEVVSEAAGAVTGMGEKRKEIPRVGDTGLSPMFRVSGRG